MTYTVAADEPGQSTQRKIIAVHCKSKQLPRLITALHQQQRLANKNDTQGDLFIFDDL